jgi:hypothetical protein
MPTVISATHELALYITVLKKSAFLLRIAVETIADKTQLSPKGFIMRRRSGVLHSRNVATVTRGEDALGDLLFPPGETWWL